MRYEDLKYSDKILPLILRHDELKKNYHVMYMHWHDAVEILLMTHGKMRIFSGKERAVAEKGQLVCIHSGHLHLYESITEECRYFCLIFPRQALDSQELYQSALPRVTADPEAKKWMEHLVAALRAREPFYREKCRGLLAQLYVRLAFLGGEEMLDDEQRPTRLVKSAMAYLDTHYYRPDICVEKVAAKVGVSRYHLCHVFKEVTGKTLSGYWQGLRCDLARRHLMDGASVAQAAEKAGFASQSYFTRAYYKHFGVLPSKDKV